MIGIRFSPVDSLFFRDGTPFASEGSAQGDVGGLFPPNPESLVGALRAALARHNGWDGVEPRWPAGLNGVLGDGPDQLGRLSFEAPYLLKDGVPYIPAPRHVLGGSSGEGWFPQALLGPGSPATCDLGEGVRLPEVVRNYAGVEPAHLKPGDGYWMPLDALGAVLRGGLPAAGVLLPQGELWDTERRIGLQRAADTRTAGEGMLYTARHVRLRRGVALGIRVSGIPGDWRLPFNSLLPLGGEGRLVECAPWDSAVVEGLQMPRQEVEASGRAMLIALTPLVLDGAVYRGEEPLPGFGGRVVSACLDRPLRIGGWDSLQRQPWPMRSVLPAGSVLFVEAEPGGRLDVGRWRGGGLPRIGERTGHGYGVVAVGVWPAGASPARRDR